MLPPAGAKAASPIGIRTRNNKRESATSGRIRPLPVHATPSLDALGRLRVHPLQRAASPAPA